MKKISALLFLFFGLCASGYAAVGSTISAGLNHVCAIKDADNTLVCWGDNEYGQTQPPNGAFLQVSAGIWFNCGLRTDYTIACWGDGGNGRTAPPGDTQPAGGQFIQVEAGGHHACALQNDGGVRCWGDSADGRTAPPPGPFKQLALGYRHSCGLRLDGSVECWGNNNNGQTDMPSDVFTSISAGVSTTCGIKTDGTGVCWGFSNGNYGYLTQIDVSIRGDDRYSGHFVICGIKENFTLSCPFTTFYKTTPPTGRFTYVTTGGAGYESQIFACGIRENNLVACWGYNLNGSTAAPTDIKIKAPFDICDVTDCTGGNGGAPRINPDYSVNVPYAIFRTGGPINIEQALWFDLEQGCVEGGLNWHLKNYGVVK